MQDDVSTYTFAAPQASNPLTVTAQLRFRRSFQAEMDLRGWQTADILMEQDTLTLPTPTWRDLYLPLLIAPP
jgi:hypothetical protein